jgi:hypothetical protein
VFDLAGEPAGAQADQGMAARPPDVGAARQSPRLVAKQFLDLRIGHRTVPGMQAFAMDVPPSRKA